MRLAVTFLVLALGVASAEAGTIWLRDDRTIEADTWWEEGEVLYYEQFGGAIGISKEDVSRIEGESKPRHFGSGILLNSQPAPPPAPTPQEPAAPSVDEPQSSVEVPLPQAPSSADILAAEEARRRRARALLDEWTRRKRNCRSEYSTASAVRRCENEADAGYRQVNERYIRRQD